MSVRRTAPTTLTLVLLALFASAFAPAPASAQGMGGDGPAADVFTATDVFELEVAADPRIAPDGESVLYVRSGFDIMEDAGTSSLWLVDAERGDQRPLTVEGERPRSPRWSPDGRRVAYIANDGDGRPQLWVRYMDSGESTKLTNLTESPGAPVWSPDGGRLAFTMFVPDAPSGFAAMPRAPEGADWGPALEVIDDLKYRSNGAGYLEDGATHIFVLPAEGGTPRQLTRGDFDHGAPVWTPDGAALVFAANRHEGWEHDPRDTELYEVRLEDGGITALTDRHGPDAGPAISPDGRRIAYTGSDERYQGYQVTQLYVMDRDGSGRRLLTADFDRDVQNPQWSGDGRGLFFQYDDEGNTKIAYIPASGGEVRVLAEDVGGLSLGRPYGGGAYTVSPTGRFAFTLGRPDHPADVAVGGRGADPRRLTRLNDDLLGHKRLGAVEEIWYESSYDGQRIQGWVVTPPGFDPSRRYPLILEIHGGPFSNYGDRFSAEVQLYAAAGYVVLYTNPRGSTSYGEAFGNAIHHAYPGHDFDDLMSGVDAVLERGYVDPDRLYVTGGSGGGVLTAWIVGHTDRFRAAVSQKPVINWYSFVLTADNPATYYRYWFPGPPWEHAEHYLERSPLHHVGEVSTPTMLITGEVDYRTPISETEQFYTALKIRKVPAAMVRVPDASHGIASKPSNLIGKVVHVLEWFERYGGEDTEPVTEP